MRTRHCLVLTCLLTASPAFACLNDRETVTLETEFRSRYESAQNPGSANSALSAAAPRSEKHLSLPGVALACAGVVFILGALKITARRMRS